MGRDHDPDVRAMLRDCLVSRRSIIGAICCHLFDVLYLIKQRPHLDGSHFFFSERLSHDQPLAASRRDAVCASFGVRGARAFPAAFARPYTSIPSVDQYVQGPSGIREGN